MLTGCIFLSYLSCVLEFLLHSQRINNMYAHTKQVHKWTKTPKNARGVL